MGELSAKLTERAKGCEKMLPKNNKLLKNARQLRKEMTRHERHLWYDFLKDYPAKFYKQKIIGNYIVDFYCHSAKLVIELDGSQHYMDDGVYHDKERDKFLKEQSLKVIRISNADIDVNFKGVCEYIDKIIKDTLN